MTNTKVSPKVLLLILMIAVSLASYKDNNREIDTEEQDLELATESEELSEVVYSGEISSLNQDINEGRNASGNVTLRVQGNELQIMVEVSGLEPNMQHLQHLHGMKDGADTTCPDSAADANNDGVVDITEAVEYAGGYHDTISC